MLCKVIFCMKTPFSLQLMYDTFFQCFNWNSWSQFSGNSQTRLKQNLETLKNLQGLHQITFVQNFHTELPILFGGIDLSSKPQTIKRILGAPKFKKVRSMGTYQWESWGYKQHYCGINAKAYIQYLDEQLMACRYKFDITSTQTLIKIKEAVAKKYKLPKNIELSNEFTITDEYGNKLIFSGYLGINIHYVPLHTECKMVLNNAVNGLELYRIKLNSGSPSKLEWVF